MPKDITADTLHQVANLARLRIQKEEEAGLRTDMAAILAFFSQLDSVDTGTIEPMAHPMELTQLPREDVVTEPDLRDQYQALAPETEEGLYRIPSVLEPE